MPTKPKSYEDLSVPLRVSVRFTFPRNPKILRIFKFFKPTGVLSTTLPSADGVCIMESLSSAAKAVLRKHAPERFVVPIGRLDKDSHGLLLLTTDESITGPLLRPSTTTEGCLVEKVYEVKTRRRVSDKQLEQLRCGIDIRIRNWSNPKDLVRTLPCIVDRVRVNVDSAPSSVPTTTSSTAAVANAATNNATKRESAGGILRFVLREGKNRQLRKMLGTLGHAVIDLKRVQFGPVKIAGLKPGELQLLNETEMGDMLRLLSEVKEIQTSEKGTLRRNDQPVVDSS
jgi:23S rRNA pseudouridine2457 synthase